MGIRKRGLTTALLGAGLAFSSLAVVAPQVQAKTDSTVQITFWKPPGLPNNQENMYFNSLIKKFEQQNPGIKVTHMIIPWADGTTKYTAAFATSSPPDVSYQINSWLTNFSSQNVLTPIEKFDPHAMVLNGIYKAYADAARGTDGQHYGVPYLSSEFVLAVNQQVWIKAGKPPLPTTYDQLVAFVKKLTFDKNGKHPGQPGFDKNHIAIYGYYQAGDAATLINYIFNWLWAYGDDYLNQKGTDIGFDNAQGRAALANMKALYDSGAATPINLYTAGGNGAVNAFLSGKIGVTWFQGSIGAQFPHTKLIVLPVPKGPKGQFLTGGAGFLTIASKSPNQQVDFKFIKFLMEPSNVKGYLRAAQLLPVENLGSDLYEGLGPNTTVLNAAEAQGKYARLLRTGLPYSPESQIIAEMLNYITGKESIDQMFSNLHNQIKVMATNAGM